jgi:hypothetical protein
MSIPTITKVPPRLSRVAFPAMFLINVPYTVMLGLAGLGDNHVAGYIAFALCLLGTVASGIVGSKRPAPKTRVHYFVDHLINGSENALVAAAAFGHVEVIFLVLFLIHLVVTGLGSLLMLGSLVIRHTKWGATWMAKMEVRQMAHTMRANGDIPADADLPPVFGQGR